MIALLLIILIAVESRALPGPPIDMNHPGSKIYVFASKRIDIRCGGRLVNVFLPDGANVPAKIPAVIYGHGQALDAENYRATLEHLARKGIAAIHPIYDTDFFDQDWQRMGSDYLSLTDCAIERFPIIDGTKLVFSGHSKGAYVAAIAAGQATGMPSGAKPGAIVLFEPARADEATLPLIAPATALTVVYGDRDDIVPEKYSRAIFELAGSRTKQFIHVKSYTKATAGEDLFADHYWPLTKSNGFGGGPEGSLHYFGAWKWLMAAARDLASGGPAFSEPYLYGDLALDKGVPGLKDDVERAP